MKQLQQHKEAWEDFDSWLIDYMQEYLNSHIGRSVYTNWKDIPFEMQLGVYLKYLQKYDAHGCENIMQTWEEVIESGFKEVNEQLTKTVI